MVGDEPKKQEIEISEEEARDIPYFEHLSEDSKRFVLEVKRLSEMSEEEYLAANPKVARLLKKDAIRKDRVEWLKQASITTMWELVKLHLLELQDFKTLGPGNYSKQTEALVNKIVDRIFDMANRKGTLRLCGIVPDRYYSKLLHALEEAPPIEISEKLKFVHWLISIYHEKASNIAPPGTANLIEDLWRYTGDPDIDTHGYILRNTILKAKEFFDKLSNLQ